jgi:hypothetical protein
MPDIEKLLNRLESIDEGLKAINKTLQRFGNYMPERIDREKEIGPERLRYGIE